MLEIAVCDDDIADLECAVNMLHKIFTSQKIAYHIAVSYTHLDVYKRQVIYTGRKFSV